jgi:tetrahydromethanopterin S-methyltransferase subunit B
MTITKTDELILDAATGGKWRKFVDKKVENHEHDIEVLIEKLENTIQGLTNLNAKILMKLGDVHSRIDEVEGAVDDLRLKLK